MEPTAEGDGDGPTSMSMSSSESGATNGHQRDPYLHLQQAEIMARTLAESQRRYREKIKKLKETVKTTREKLDSERNRRKELLDSHIVWLQRELGTVNLPEYFSNEELGDLTQYVATNPFIRSLLEKRNPTLLKNLMSFSVPKSNSETSFETREKTSENLKDEQDASNADTPEDPGVSSAGEGQQSSSSGLVPDGENQ